MPALPAAQFKQYINILIHDPSPIQKTMGGILASAVRQYLATHKDKLPAIAIRETFNKLEHGIKSPKKQ